MAIGCRRRATATAAAAAAAATTTSASRLAVSPHSLALVIARLKSLQPARTGSVASSCKINPCAPCIGGALPAKKPRAASTADSLMQNYSCAGAASDSSSSTASSPSKTAFVVAAAAFAIGAPVSLGLGGSSFCEHPDAEWYRRQHEHQMLGLTLVEEARAGMWHEVRSILFLTSASILVSFYGSSSPTC
eukprot:5467085-Pleurochrysis_carterae.AAC.3